MRNQGRAMIAAVVASIGAGAIRMVYGHRHAITRHVRGAKQRARRVGQNISIRSFALRTAYKHLPNVKKSKVYRVYARIVPDQPKSAKFQLHAKEYLGVLQYAAARWEYHNNDARTYLHIHSRARMANLTHALLRQHLLIHDTSHQELNRHGINGRNYVNRTGVKKVLRLLSPYASQRLINARLFSKTLLNIIAIEMYS